MNPAHAVATISSKRPTMVSRHHREVHLTDKCLYLLIQYKSPKVWNQVNNAIGVYLQPKKKHFTLTAPQAKSPQITEQTH